MHRSKGTRGAGVDTLRGSTGADFESEAIVTRGKNGIELCTCLGRTKDSNKKKYLLVKGPHVFVFNKATSSSPQFAIPLKYENVSVHKSHGKTQVVTLENGLGDVEYMFKFDLSENKQLGRNFGHILETQIVVGNSVAAKERLGHDSNNKSKSFRYAHAICSKKEKEQPKALVVASDPIDIDALF